jgi:hypothetical protein
VAVLVLRTQDFGWYRRFDVRLDRRSTVEFAHKFSGEYWYVECSPYGADKNNAIQWKSTGSKSRPTCTPASFHPSPANDLLLFPPLMHCPSSLSFNPTFTCCRCRMSSATHAFTRLDTRVSHKFDSTRTRIIDVSRRSDHLIFV